MGCLADTRASTLYDVPLHAPSSQREDIHDVNVDVQVTASSLIPSYLTGLFGQPLVFFASSVQLYGSHKFRCVIFPRLQDETECVVFPASATSTWMTREQVQSQSHLRESTATYHFLALYLACECSYLA